MALMMDSANDRRSESVLPEPKSRVTPQALASPIPNGGLIAWLQVVGSFMAFLNTWYVLCVPLL